MNRPTLANRIESILLITEIGGEIDAIELIKSLYDGKSDFFTRRTFDVHYVKAKRSIYESKGFKFERKDGIITRIQNRVSGERIEDYIVHRKKKVKRKIYNTGKYKT